MKKFKVGHSNRTMLQRLWLGFKKAWPIPTIPEYFLKIHVHPITRVFRFIGGFSWVSLLGGRLLDLPIYLTIIAVIFTIFHFIYITVLNIVKFKHLIKILQSKELDVRNSPLDLMVKNFARLIYCAKVGCGTASSVGVATGIMLGIDQILEGANRSPFFKPYLNAIIQKLFPDGRTIVDNILEEMAENKRAKNELGGIKDIIAKKRQRSRFKRRR